MRRYGLRDDPWKRIRDLPLGREGHVGITAADNRRFVEAVPHRHRAGIPWRGPPERSGGWKNTHQRLSLWSASGVRARVSQHPAADAGNEHALLNSTIVHARQHGARARKDSAGTRRSSARAVGRATGRTFRPMRSTARPPSTWPTDRPMLRSAPLIRCRHEGRDADRR